MGVLRGGDGTSTARRRETVLSVLTVLNGATRGRSPGRVDWMNTKKGARRRLEGGERVKIMRGNSPWL